MKKTFVASGLAILIVLLAWWKFTATDEPVQLEPSFVETDLTEAETELPPAKLANGVPEGVETEPPARDADARQTPESTRTFDVVCEDADGNPVAGSEVYLVEVVSGGHGKTVGPIKSDDDGLASFEGIPSDAEPWLLRFYARLPGGDLAGFGQYHVPRGALVEDEHEAAAVVVLAETAALEGVVVVPDATDLSGVTVSVQGLYFHHPESTSPLGETFETRGGSREQLWPRLFSRTPDADGRFGFGELPAQARVRLVARGPGLARATSLVRPPWSGEEIVIDMVREGVIEGDLTYEDDALPVDGLLADGLPAVGVTIVASALHTGRPFETVVDAEGRFRLDGLPENIYDLSLPADFDRSEWTMAATNSLRVLAGQTTDDIHLRLERCALVTGTVSDASTGLPVSMSVAAISGWGKRGRPIGGAFTDSDGRYEIRLPRGRSTLYLANILPEYRYPDDQVRRQVSIGEGETLKEDVNFELPRRDAPRKAITLGRAHGRVVGVDGHPLEGVTVRAYTLHDPDNPILGLYNRTTRTDEEGSYELLVPAAHELHLMAGGPRFSSAEARRFRVEDNGVHEVEVLVLRSGTSFIEGRVVNPVGEPVQGASIWVSSRSKRSLGQDAVLTDADGSFRVEHLLEDEPLDVAVTKPGYARRRYAKVPPGSIDLRLEIRREDGGSGRGE